MNYLLQKPTNHNLFAALFLLSGLLLATKLTQAAEVTRTDIESWLATEVAVDPPAAGSTLGLDAIDDLSGWLPPGYIDEFRFDDVQIEIQATADYPGHRSYVDATEAFAGQASIGSDGRLENYTAGRPFSSEQITEADPATAGFMVAWNQIHRWQYTGYKVDALSMSYVAPGNPAGPLDADKGLNGGGSLTRRLTQYYHRVYLSKLAWLGEQDYRYDVPDSDSQFFKDYISFLDPFDVKGTSFVVERHLDPTADDQVNIYSPSERRVRRFSAKERADSFMGSEGTLDDFEGFSGRVLDYRWQYLGRHPLLYIIDSKHEIAQSFGPHSRLPDDRWQLRDCHIVEVKSVLDDHPYGSRILFVDAQTWGVGLSLVIDHDENLWKTFQTVYRGPLDPSPDASPELTVIGWRGQFNIDRTTNNATVVQALTPTEHPAMKPSQIKRMFSVSNLTSGR